VKYDAIRASRGRGGKAMWAKGRCGCCGEEKSPVPGGNQTWSFCPPSHSQSPRCIRGMNCNNETGRVRLWLTVRDYSRTVMEGLRKTTNIRSKYRPSRGRESNLGLLKRRSANCLTTRFDVS
jgi:hypothetical protein